MKAYSEDLRRKIVEAIQRGTPKSEAARSFGVGISSVKRYVAAAREGRSLAPKKLPGSKPKLEEGPRRLLEADLEEHPAATRPERLVFVDEMGTNTSLAPLYAWSRRGERARFVRCRETGEPTSPF